MPAFDLPPEELRRHHSSVQCPEDFAEFWDATLAQSRKRAQRAEFTRIDAGLSHIDVFDVTFSGFDGQPVKGWYHLPHGYDGGLAFVRYVGYNCGRGLPHSASHFALAGHPVLTMDNRGQGAVNGYVGDTPDHGTDLRILGGHVMRGYESPERYYFRRLFADAALAIDALRQRPEIETDQTAVAGVSQGGGIAVAAGGLVPDVAAVLADVPFLCEIPRGIQLSAEGPYTEMATVLASYPSDVPRALDTLRYFDVSLFASQAVAPAVFSVGLMDPVCPPSTVYAAYNAYAGPKEIREYPYNGHEGGSFHQEAAQLAWLRQRFPLPQRRDVFLDATAMSEHQKEEQ